MASQTVTRAKLVRKVKDAGLEFSMDAHRFLNRVVDNLIEKGISKAKQVGAKRIKPEHFE